MSMQSSIARLSSYERLNFLLTNRIPRYAATRFMGWFSKLRIPVLTRVSISIWRLFAHDLDLAESKQTEFVSLHDCFIRELKDGARTVDMDPNVVASPCDAIIGACGAIEGQKVYQAKGFPYELSELVDDTSFAKDFENGTFVTLRLKSSMYHRFHAPVDCQINRVVYLSGDTWNVNPATLKRIEKLFCKNERAYLRLAQPNSPGQIALVPIAAILVASMRIHCLRDRLNLAYNGPKIIGCNARYKRGQEMGYFEHGSTIIMFADDSYVLAPRIKEGSPIKMGEALLSKLS